MVKQIQKSTKRLQRANTFGKYSFYYDDFYAGKDYLGETKFVVETLRKYAKEKINSILSLGCGTCNYELILAKRGFAITGIDISAEMLRIAKGKIRKKRLEDRIELRQANIQDFLIDKSFDACIAMFNVIGYQRTSDELEKVCTNVAKHLKPGGLFVFDCWHAPAVLKDKPTDRVKEVTIGGKRVIRFARSKLDLINEYIEINYDVLDVKDKKILSEVKETHLIKYWNITELKYVLEKNGFEFVNACNFLDLESEVADDRWDIFIIARKKA